MRVLYNTTQYAAMNDVSVTSGNADGWILLPPDPVAHRLEPMSPPVRKRPQPAAKKPPRSSKRKR